MGDHNHGGRRMTLEDVTASTRITASAADMDADLDAIHPEAQRAKLDRKFSRDLKKVRESEERRRGRPLYEREMEEVEREQRRKARAVWFSQVWCIRGGLSSVRMLQNKPISLRDGYLPLVPPLLPMYVSNAQKGTITCSKSVCFKKVFSTVRLPVWFCVGFGYVFPAALTGLSLGTRPETVPPEQQEEEEGEGPGGFLFDPSSGADWKEIGGIDVL